MKLRNEKGFTLLEILVVISLILIIAGIALPKFLGVSDEGKKAKSAAELKTMQTALESYLLNTTGSVPANFGALETALEAATPRLIGDVSKFYDPFGATATTNYSYMKSVNDKYYVLRSLGPDKAADITAVSSAGVITGGPGDDIYVSNGSF